MKDFKTTGEFNIYLKQCYDLVLKDMKESGLIEEWDGMPTMTNAERHFDNIVKWCKESIKSHVWSCHSSSTKAGFNTSYGAKHLCEKDLKCYVANNWMKLAMIWSGLEVCSLSCFNRETGRVKVKPVTFQDILTNDEKFICRRVNYGDDWQYRYNCIYPFPAENLKYIS